MQLQAGNNIGYYGPYERLLRGRGKEHDFSFWQGCGAGLSTLGIEADGAIKGCPSLPTTAYTGGNIREHTLHDIIEGAEELRFNLGAGTPEGTKHLWGFCKTCEYAELCRGGCSWTAHVFFNKRGNNPYCHHRALVNAKQGMRERVVPKVKAQGLPFDNGEFELIVESTDTFLPANDRLHFTADSIQWSESWQQEPEFSYSLVR